MPQINVNGELREVSQAEYDALTTNGQASTPAAGSYEQYAAARAKENKGHHNGIYSREIEPR